MSKILIADDNEEMLDTLSRIFGLYDFNVETALNGIEAINIAEQTKPDIIILDGMMPEMDGFDACQILKQKENTKDIPVVFLTANFMELRDRIKGLELGADDYLLKPFNSKELVARIRSILKRTQNTKDLKAENQQLINQNRLIENEFKKLLEEKTGKNPQQVMDKETGLYDFNFFKERTNQELQRSKRFNNDLSLLIISFDKFKKISEILGGQLFNYLVIKIANFILTQTREIDMVSFDEDTGFMLLLPQTDYVGAEAKGEKLCKALVKNEYIDEDILKTLEFSRKKLSDVSKLSFTYGIASINKNDMESKAEYLFENAKSSLSEHCLK